VEFALLYAHADRPSHVPLLHAGSAARMVRAAAHEGTGGCALAIRRRPVRRRLDHRLHGHDVARARPLARPPGHRRHRTDSQRCCAAARGHTPRPRPARIVQCARRWPQRRIYTTLYTLSLHDALPIFLPAPRANTHELLTNSRWHLQTHEFEYSVGFVPLWVIALAVGCGLYALRGGRFGSRSPSSGAAARSSAGSPSISRPSS
jgi:hypothetical protein